MFLRELEDIHDELAARHFRQGEGPHGLDHWRRVAEVGAVLAQRADADPAVVLLFACFHDACRICDGFDPEHGLRAARLAEEMNSLWLGLSPDRLRLLSEALERHSAGESSPNPTLATCWAADRIASGAAVQEPPPVRKKSQPKRRRRH